MANELLFSSVYARLLLRAEIAGLEHVAQQTLLEGTGLSDATLAEQSYLAWPQVRRLLTNIEAAGANADWPIRFAEQLTIGSHGPMGFAALSAPTLSAAMDVLIDYHAIRTATINAALEKSDTKKNKLPPAQCRLIIKELTGDSVYGRQIAETTIKVILTVIETLVGHALKSQVLVQFIYPPSDSAGNAQAMAKSLGVSCEYNCEQTAILFPVSWLSVVSPLYDDAVYRANIIKCREQIQALYQQSNDPVAMVKNRLAQHFEQSRAGELNEPIPDLNQCAALINLSPRTLIRRLDDVGESYKGLLKAERQKQAVDMLCNTHLSVADIAVKLGYGDTSNFVRAFKQWVGETPSGWRRKAHS